MQTLPDPIAQALAPFAPADSAVRKQADEAAAIRADLYLNAHKIELRDARMRDVALQHEHAMAWARGARA